MADTADQTLKTFLQDRARQVRELEAEAARSSTAGATRRCYEAKMSEKAELLADLAEEAGPCWRPRTRPRPGPCAPGSGIFSANAARSLDIGSVFYMSALLYPDDHREGEPNNLERLISEVFPG